VVTIRQFQKMMHTLYFSRDQKRGDQQTFNWLREELEELYGALKEGNIEAVEEEFADVLAWLTSLANISNVDLEGAVLKKYNYLCPKCNKSPCSCSFR
jgi:NTP pyrophosphatase (non-canonical NTP hydrolase)